MTSSQSMLILLSQVSLLNLSTQMSRRLLMISSLWMISLQFSRTSSTLTTNSRQAISTLLRWQTRASLKALTTSYARSQKLFFSPLFMQNSVSRQAVMKTLQQTLHLYSHTFSRLSLQTTAVNLNSQSTT